VSAVRVVRATDRDADEVTRCIAEAFQFMGVTGWLIADPAERVPVLHANFRIFVDHALEHGVVWTTLERTAAAVWFPQDGPEPLPEISDYDRRVEAACGPYAERFRILDTYFAKHHLADPHHYLFFLAVAPGHQRRGIGSALLNQHHARLDEAKTAAGLVATSLDARRLYLRHGYTDDGAPLDLPDGPRMWPMSRTPA
jgi:ribosomal protein S18 acetylase RimI-like enzyme